MKKYVKIFFSRFTFVALTIIALFILDFCVAFGPFYVLREVLKSRFPDLSWLIMLVVDVLRWIFVTLTVLHVANRDMIPEAKIPWLLCVIVLNLFGAAIYFVFSYNRPSRKQRRTLRSLYAQSERFQRSEVTKGELAAFSGHWASVSNALLYNNPRSVVHANTKTQYFPSGEQFFAALTEDLRGAREYIFLEYFILAKGEMWGEVHEILLEKVKEGVEVRLIYDDIGCMGKLRAGYHKALCKEGIKCVKFNPFVPVVTNLHNNRDHRKIAVIDGRIGYTGGINLSDEYINAVQPFGKWKDSAVRLEGEGVKSLVLMFLRFFNLRAKEAEDFSPYIPDSYEAFEGEGYVQPYGDGPRPLYGRHLGEDVYINILNGAKTYCWIMTPYLIIDYRMHESMLSAAARGVDVRIVTPHIPDKKTAFALTRSNYMALIKGGVKIYEYTPGFVHAKSFLADDEVAVVGTINLDYRSLLHHYENAVLMFGARANVQLKEDFRETFEISKLQTEEDAKKSVVWRGICEIAKVFAPLF